MGSNSRKLMEFDFFSSALKRGNRISVRHSPKNNLNKLNYLQSVRTLIKSVVGRVKLNCLRSLIRVLYIKRRLALVKNNLVYAKNAGGLFNSKTLYFNFLNLRALSTVSTLQNCLSRFPTLAGIDSSHLFVAANEFFNMLKFVRTVFRGPFGFSRTLTASTFLSRGYSFFSPMRSFSFFVGRNTLHFCLNKAFLFGRSYAFLGLNPGKDCTAATDIAENIIMVDEKLLVFVETGFVCPNKYLGTVGVPASLFALTG